eukprot:scaffold81831_cov46-Attheya_sp.AAC.1
MAHTHGRTHQANEIRQISLQQHVAIVLIPTLKRKIADVIGRCDVSSMRPCCCIAGRRVVV